MSQVKTTDDPIPLREITFTPITHPDTEAGPRDESTTDCRPCTCRNMEGKWKIIIIAATAIAVVIIAIIVAGIQTVEYHELGMLKRKSTGHVDTSAVYHSTRIVRGPDYTMVKFPATAQFVELNLVAVTKNNQNIKCVIRFQYFIRPDELGMLYENHKFSYHDVIVKTAIDSIKDTTSDYLVDEFINNREAISEDFFTSLRRKLQGICCLKNCNSTRLGCLDNCKKSNCSEADRGMFVEVRYFQLGDVSLNAVVKDKKLKTLILTEKEERKGLEQQAAVVRMETERQVRKLKAQTNEVKEQSLADANLIKKKADSEHDLKTETARVDGLRKMYEAIGFTEESDRNAFDYYRTLQSSKHVSMSVGFTQYISGNFPKT